ncbi:translation elongation factor 1B (aEF-1B) [Thermoplasmatales archaeon SCGC AB-539-N05]|nr:translation elongation factor 1B (aEF-1B) [Thermoplasmatales archaeon SCGC AB-539-N05]
MGEVVALIRVMPDGVLDDAKLNDIMNEIKNLIKNPVKLGRLEIKDVAFGLRALNVTVIVPDSEGGVEPIADVLSKIKGVESAEVVDIGRI